MKNVLLSNMILKVHFLVHLLNVQSLNLDNAFRFYDHLNRSKKRQKRKNGKNRLSALHFGLLKNGKGANGNAQRPQTSI
jgi:hypothetical protein